MGAKPSQKHLLAQALGRDPHAEMNLKRSRRPNEIIVQIFLFFCAILSIFTTIGIVIVLGSESISFFTRQLWENSNKGLAITTNADETSLILVASGRNLPETGTIRISTEVMEVLQYTANSVTINVNGTGAGFAQLCTGESDLTNASRAISDAEYQTCRENNIEPVAFPIAMDALSIVVNSQNSFVENVTLEELRLIFGSAQFWSDVRPEWPPQPIMRFIPGTDSGTFDYFVEAVFSGNADAFLLPNEDPDTQQVQSNITSEDDNQLVRGISENRFAVGFFGYGYYVSNASTLRALSVDGVAPSATSVDDGSYPLARPLYIYSTEQALREKANVAGFLNFYLSQLDTVVSNVGYVPESTDTIAQAQQTWLTITGTSGDTLPALDITQLQGDLSIVGSSTVAPITRRVASLFTEAGFLPHAEVIRGVQGTFPINHPAGATVEIGDRATLWEFVTNTVWQPAIREFGILPLVNATLMTTFIAMLVALPLGLGAAIYLSEYAHPTVRATLKPILEILAGIPTVVYGYFALTFVTPLLRSIFGVDVVSFYNTASAGLVMGILIIPLVSSMSEDALSAVPRALREASYGLGATRLETTIKVVIPAALSGILAAFIISVSRAIGETMIVAIAAGAGPNFTFNPFQSAETMTGHIARISGGDLSYDSIDYNSIFAIGLMLFLVTLALNLISNSIIKRFREAY